MMKQKAENGSTYKVEQYEDESIVKISKNMQQNAKKVPVIW
jgi:hypothetical protein